LTYGEVNTLVRSLAMDLRQAGVRREDRVAVVIPNGRDMCTTLLGVCSAAIAAPLNPDYQEEEFADYFREIRVSYLVISRGADSPARAAAARLGLRVLEWCKEASGILPEGETKRTARDRIEIDLPDPQDIALILLTSGSTGRSKKVPLTHRNLCVSVRDICRALALTPEDRCLCMWEQFHIGGLVDLLMVPLASGGTVICTGGFDAGHFFELLKSASPTWYQGVPATVHELMAYAGKHSIPSGRSSLRFVRVTASALAPSLMSELEEFFGVPVITTFGMTEAAPLITTNLLPPHVRKAGSTGPSCGPEVAVMDEDGRLLPIGEIGEVVVKGENIFSGYEDAPEANARSFRDGWFRTGDTGYLDEDGYLFLKGRIKETINRGGEKITPQEIDDVLLTHPEIAEAVSFHIPHRVLGEDVAVAVVLRRPGSLSEDEVRKYVAARMVAFKVPRKVIFVDSFARNASGKVNRSTLAETFGLQTPAEYEAPATEMEKRIAGIWQRELNVPQVGRNDSYTDLGGDSLSTIRMILELEKTLSTRLPIELFGAISIAIDPLHRIAVALEQQSQTPKNVFDSSLTSPGNEPEEILANLHPENHHKELTPDDYRAMLIVVGRGSIPTHKPGSIVKVANIGGSRRPIFWFFNAPNQELKGLAEVLGPDQPIYGFYSGALMVDEEKVSAIAEHYIREVQAIQPDGPLIIAGNCRGGRCAIRMAVKLRELGREVSHLCILEMFERALYDYDGKVLLMFGDKSEEFRHRDMNWGHRGWRLPFRTPPRVEWVKGRHAEFFSPRNATNLASHLVTFLKDEPVRKTLGGRCRDYTILLLHRIPPAFKLYVRLATRP
ncbi:MAG: hypothetical protein RIR25_399, partial [Verrucomicrobiota bacterium]